MTFLKSLIIILICFNVCISQNTVGLINKNASVENGYVLFSPLTSTTTYLINNDGEKLHSWTSKYNPGNSVYLLEDGNLLHTGNVRNNNFNAGGAGGIIELLDWESNVLWSYTFSDTENLSHHDIELLPNGNILAIVWEKKSSTESIDTGRDPSFILDNEVWSEKIVEIKPKGTNEAELVWEWKVWDHLVQDFSNSKSNYGEVKTNPQLINLNYVGQGPNAGMADWLHINSVDYNSELDQIILSVHNFSEIWIIDHSTTIIEASGHSGGTYDNGGDLLYRWGNPQTYNNGSSQDQKLFAQHDAQWIKTGLPGEGNILIFNNGDMQNRKYSSADELVIPINQDGSYDMNSGKITLPNEFFWSYENNPDFYSPNISGVQRLPNGNTLICEGASGEIFEVTNEGEIVWYYINPVTKNGIVSQGETASTNPVFRAIKYAENYAGFDGKDLTPKGTIEISTTSIERLENKFPDKFELKQNYPNPFNPSTNITFSIADENYVTLKIFNSLGKEVEELVNERLNDGTYNIKWNAENLSSGLYIYKITVGNFSESKKMILIK